jgi:hypothetical protein
MFFPIGYTLQDFPVNQTTCVGNFPIKFKFYTIPMQFLWIKWAFILEGIHCHSFLPMFRDESGAEHFWFFHGIMKGTKI